MGLEFASLDVAGVIWGNTLKNTDRTANLESATATPVGSNPNVLSATFTEELSLTDTFFDIIREVIAADGIIQSTELR